MRGQSQKTGVFLCPPLKLERKPHLGDFRVEMSSLFILRELLLVLPVAGQSVVKKLCLIYAKS